MGMAQKRHAFFLIYNIKGSAKRRDVTKARRILCSKRATLNGFLFITRSTRVNRYTTICKNKVFALSAKGIDYRCLANSWPIATTG